MVTLMCFCCDHRNPVGAKFCNACGTPLHLKPCKHCEAINVRAAAHCHRCGETFTLEFPSQDEAPSLPDAPGATGASAPSGTTFDAANSQAPPRRLVAKRAGVLLLGMAATALLSAYYAYRQPGIGAHAARDADNSPLAGAAVATDERAEPTRALMSARPVPGSSLESNAAESAPAGPRISVGAADAAPATRADVNGVARVEARTPQASATRARPSAKRSVGASTPKPKAAGGVAGPIRTEPVAAGQPSKSRQVEAPPPPDSGPIALQQAVAMPPVRSVAADSPPVQRPKVSAKPPAPASSGWDRPCAEGVALDASCDVRTMPKGN